MLLTLPILIPLITAATSLLAFRSRKLQRVLGLAGVAMLLGAGLLLLAAVWIDGIQTVQIGVWSAPFGISLVADLFAAIMVVLAGLIGLATAIYSIADIDPPRQSFGYYPLFQIILMGVCGAFLTGDMFNLYVWFEVLLIASFVLMVLGGEQAQMEGAIKYVTINLLASALLLAAVGLLYGTHGTLNMADLALTLRTEGRPDLVGPLAMLFLVAFGIKAAIFPLFFWLPASYHTPPVAVSAVFAGLLTKVGVYALIRVFTLLFNEAGGAHRLILLLSAITMIVGVLGAVSQHEFRRILSFHIISQIGYMVAGLGLFTALALAGSIFYIMHHIVVKTNLFLISGIAARRCGSFELVAMGGLYRSRPALSALFLISALSLAGSPPLSGFFAKLILVQAALGSGQYALVTVMLVVSLLTLLSMNKIWIEAFWSPRPDTAGVSEPDPDSSGAPGTFAMLQTPIVVLAAVTVVIGLAVQPFFLLSLRASEQLKDPDQYIHAVLGDRP